MPDGGAAGLANVFAPVRIGALELPHRVVMGSMHMGVEAEPDAGERLAAFYRERARGGAGLIVTGGWAVSADGAVDDGYGLIDTDAGAAALERIAGAADETASGCGDPRGAGGGGPRAHVGGAGAAAGPGAAIALQLFHAGRYALAGGPGEVVAPSAIAGRVSRAEPRALGEDEVWDVVAEFAAAADRARELGFAAVEVMGSEGYLVDQFLSPATNRREDSWGGDAEGRMRFGVELASAVRAAVGPDFPVIFRMTGAELMPESRPFEEVEAFAVALVGAGVDALNIGVGWHESTAPTVQGAVPAGAWMPWAEAIKRAIGGPIGNGTAGDGVAGDGTARITGEARITGTAATSAGMAAVPVIAGNRINRMEDADALLGGGIEGRQGVDLVSMSRPFLADPRIVAKAREARATNVCISCNQACIDRSLSAGRVSCLVNPRAGFEREFPERDGLSGGEGSGAERPARGVGSGTGESGVDGRTGRIEGSDGTDRPGDRGGPGERGASGGNTGFGDGARGRRFPGFGDRARGRRFAVIGGGPAGMEAARALAALGERVELFEAGPELGGQFRLARLVPGKEDYGATIDYFEAELERLGVVIRLGRELSEDDADLFADLDGVVLATGVLPRRVDIPGADLGHVVDYVEAFERGLDGAERVAIVGAGGIGVDLAHRLTQAEPADPYEAFYDAYAVQPPGPVPCGVRKGHIATLSNMARAGSAGSDPPSSPVRNPRISRLSNRAEQSEARADDFAPPRVTLMRRSGRIGAGIGRTTRWVWLDALRHAGVETRTGLAYRAITPAGVEIERDDGVETIAADRVVIAAGQERNDGLRPLLERLEIPHRVVGGAENPSELNAVRAFADGLRAAHDLAG